jgi:hypothetical protein
MKFYIFPNGSLKLDNLELSEVIAPDYIKVFKEVSRVRYVAHKTKGSTKKVWNLTKKAAAASKRKAIQVKDALKT